NLPGWDNVHITDMLFDRFGIPAYICNDANACALAEWRFGEGRGSRNMIFLTFGTGLGAGIILDGRLYSGTNGMAGEVGHIRLSDGGPVGFGKHGSFEGYCSGGGIAQLGRRAARTAIENGTPFVWAQNDDEISKITTKYLAELANTGDENAIQIFRESAKRLGFGLSILIDILNPERIIIGSVYQRCESLFYTEMMRVIEKEALPESLSVCKILPAALGDEIGDLAAISVAMKGIEQ
ncbi:MAG: ROK family protein, partial [Clostridia bacterium]|nr:ROK family protein [Clostridia bacterium]